MAVHGTLNLPYSQPDLELIVVPGPKLVLPLGVPGPDGLGAVIPNRFPTPPSAMGFLWDHDPEFVFDVIEGHIVAGALAPFSDYYLEPTTGQIWPRG
jgi:hypothetical protein